MTRGKDNFAREKAGGSHQSLVNGAGIPQTDGHRVTQHAELRPARRGPRCQRTNDGHPGPVETNDQKSALLSALDHRAADV